ncbi:copper chaperone PCu(A)C [Rubrivivax gelatinosus]|uniref:Copper chaperone PCu(A)C n=1 Tax=Rubrivivax gelatinosus (strain NBRC 100245 / IL144) TaxID=983917 RepID=I0HRF8_RUBGI|nr:copper chaperone PCu(A)C [Rubrivivax gelatinosus]BAL95595.1 hypothetical protein RGE_22540 [Rubrivivax gelatinosus IL144]
MSPAPSRRALLQAGLLLCTAAVLPRARACEFFATTLRVTHPWTRATAPYADSCIVSLKIDEVASDDRLVALRSPVATGARVDGHDGVDVPIPAGRETVFGDGGPTLRLVGLRHPLEIARSYPLELVFERGGTVAATLNVDYGRFL